MVYNSKCLTLALLCHNIILFFSIHVTGEVPPFPFSPPSIFPPPVPGLLPPVPGLLPPGLPDFYAPPFPRFSPPIQGSTPPPPGVQEICPKNEVTMKIVCANVIGIPALPVSRLLNPPSSPCCKYIEGLLDTEVANCFCSAITFDTYNPKTDIPASLVMLLNYCQKELPHGFRCATSSST